jgi:DNA polymerase I-like protein with 3'-5' exonuclease and polymerase domains
LEKTSAVIQEVMQKAFKLSIPLKTDAKAGKNWSEMKPV